MSILSLHGKRGLIVGVANDQSIAYGCAKAMRDAGAEMALTYLNDKALPHVKPLADALAVRHLLPLDLRVPGQLEAVFETLNRDWGKLDFLVHAVAFAHAQDLNGRVTDCSENGFMEAMNISCHSFIRMARLAEPMMQEKGGSLITLTYHGSETVIPGYGIMGPVKAALESTTRYLAAELGQSRIRVNAISAGLLKTRAAGGIAAFDQLFARAEKNKPIPDALTITDVGATAAFLASDGAKSITGGIHFVDGGYHLVD